MASATSDDGFHEIQLNGKQLVFLFMAVTVVTVVVFLCGVLVGRGVRLAQGPADIVPGDAETITVPDPPPLAATGNDTPTTTKEDLSYNQRLTDAQTPREQLAPPARPAPAPTPQTESIPAAAATAAASANGLWTIQVAALRQRSEADAIVKTLGGKGYDAYAIDPEKGGPSVFRVRVGHFKERREAEAVAGRLAKEEKFNPWIVR